MNNTPLEQYTANKQAAGVYIESPKFTATVLPATFIPLEISGTTPEELLKWFQGPIPEIGEECVYVCIGRTPTSVSMAFVTRQHLENLRSAK